MLATDQKERILNEVAWMAESDSLRFVTPEADPETEEAIAVLEMAEAAASLYELLGEVDFSEAFSDLLEGLGAIDFGAGSRKATGKKPNCNPGRSWSCGWTCLPMSKKRCGSPLPGEPATYADYLSKQATAATPTPKKTRAKKAATPAPTTDQSKSSNSNFKDALSKPTDTDFSGWDKSKSQAQKDIAARFATQPDKVAVLRGDDGSVRGAAVVFHVDGKTVVKAIHADSDDDRERLVASIASQSAQLGSGGKIELTLKQAEAKKLKKLGFESTGGAIAKSFGFDTVTLEGEASAKLIEKNKGLFGDATAADSATKARDFKAQELKAQLATWTSLKPVKAVDQASRSQLDSNLTVSGNSRIKSDSLDKAFDKFTQANPDATERFENLRQFMNSRGLQVMFSDHSDSQTSQAKQFKAKLEDTDFAKNAKKNVVMKSDKDFIDQAITLTPGTGGFTSADYRHVMVGSNSKNGKGDFDVDPQKLATMADSAISSGKAKKPQWGVVGQNHDADDESTFITALHEIGHQVHFSAEAPKPPKKMKAVSQYGQTDHYETFAESFALYMIDAKKYKAYDPVGHDWVEGILKNSVKK